MINGELGPIIAVSGGEIVIDGELGPTIAVSGGVGWGPAIPQSECISEGTFV